MASIELDPFLHRAPRLNRPTVIVFDLDPGGGADILDGRGSTTFISSQMFYDLTDRRSDAEPRTSDTRDAGRSQQCFEHRRRSNVHEDRVPDSRAKKQPSQHSNMSAPFRIEKTAVRTR